MATESVPAPSNVIPFPAWRSEQVTWERRAREIIMAESVEQVRMSARESDEALSLVASRILQDAQDRGAKGDATPHMLCVGVDGAIELLRVVAGARIPAGYELATVITPDTDVGRIAYRLREAMSLATAAA